MKKMISNFCLLFLVTISCNSSKAPDHTEKKSEVPDAFDNSEIKISRYGSGDVVGALYKELVEKQPELQNIEDKIKELKETNSKLNTEFGEYNGNSLNYYNSTTYKLASIKDSLLKAEIEQLINRSKKQYDNFKSSYDSDLKTALANSNNIDDYHQALQVVLTLPVIAAYQKDNLPDNKAIRDLIKQQEEITGSMKKKMPTVN